MEKRGQVTIFIIIAIVVVAAGTAVYVVFPKIQTSVQPSSNNPVSFIENCVGDDLKNNVEQISLQGGSLNPGTSFTCNDYKVSYLAYTTLNYNLPCVIQKPFLKQSIETEIKDSIKEKVEGCFSEMKNDFEAQGYSVNYKPGLVSVELLPQRIILRLEKDLTVTKDDTKTYDKIEVVLNNNLYELVIIADSIVENEATSGDVYTTTYMDYYHDLKVEKSCDSSDGDVAYLLTTRSTGDKFQFATRCVVYPPGITPRVQ